MLKSEAGAAKYGPTVPICGGVGGLGAEVEPLTLDAAASFTGALMVQRCMVAMGEAVVQGALHGTDNTAIVVGKATHAIVLVGISTKGHHDIAPSVIFRCFIHSRPAPAAGDGCWDVIAKAAQHVEIVQHAVGVEICLSRAVHDTRVHLLEGAGFACSIRCIQLCEKLLPICAMLRKIAKIIKVIVQDLA